MQHLVQIAHLGEFILYYVLGYLLISSILAAVGSACNTLKEAQPMMAPLTLLLIVPMMFWMQITQPAEFVDGHGVDVRAADDARSS